MLRIFVCFFLFILLEFASNLYCMFCLLRIHFHSRAMYFELWIYLIFNEMYELARHSIYWTKSNKNDAMNGCPEFSMTEIGYWKRSLSNSIIFLEVFFLLFIFIVNSCHFHVYVCQCDRDCQYFFFMSVRVEWLHGFGA